MARRRWTSRPSPLRRPSKCWGCVSYLAVQWLLACSAAVGASVQDNGRVESDIVLTSDEFLKWPGQATDCTECVNWDRSMW